LVSEPQRGEVWWAAMPDKRRPVLILTRNGAIPVLHSVVVAPITRRIRRIPTEVVLNETDGMPTECAATLDNITIADKTFLADRLTQLSPPRMAEVCRALNIAVGC
jgi:mRNA interferase MazF